MMRRHSIQFATSALAGVLALSAAVPARAQQSSTAAGSSSRPRSTDERVNTELATPPPVNSDYRRAAEGTLPVVPGSAAPRTGPAVPGAAMDPAARPLGSIGGAASSVPATGMMAPGMDIAMLVEHAVSMGIEGCTLAGLAEANKPDAEGNDAVKALLSHALDEMKESKELLTQAAAAGSAVDGTSPVRKFYGAANNYMTALAMLNSPGGAVSPNDKAQIAAINHAVKGVMDASHILQFGAAPAGAPALDKLTAHARMMKDEGTKMLEKMAGTAPVDPSMPPSPMILAQRGRELIDAAGALAPMGRMMGNGGPGGLNANNTGNVINGQGPNPGRLQDTRPEIIGGTYGTGSQTAGTSTGAEAARNVKDSVAGPGGVLNVPTPTGAPGSGPSGYGVGNNNTPPTNSNAGSRPR